MCGTEPGAKGKAERKMESAAPSGGGLVGLQWLTRWSQLSIS